VRELDPTARRLLARLLVHAPRLAVAGGAVLVASLGQLALTWLIKLWSDTLLGGADPVALRRLLALAVATLALLLVAVFLSRYLLASFEKRLVQELRDEAGAALLAAEVGTVQATGAGEWLSRLFNDPNALTGFVEDLLRRLLGGMAVSCGALVMMFVLDARLTLAVALAVPIAALLFSLLGRRIRGWSRLAQEELGEATALATEQIQGLPTIKAYQTEPEEVERLRAAGARYVARSLAAEWWSTALVTSVWLTTALGLLAAVWYGSRQVIDGARSPGDLLVFALYAAQAIEPLRRLSDFQGRWQRTLAAAARIFALIDLPDERRRGGRRPLPEPARGALEVDQVSFAYHPDQSVLEELSFRLDAGETAALVAASGGGKSTLAKLLLAYLSPGTGRLRIDGVDLREADLAELRRRVGVVFQEPFLFRGTLADNLRYGAGSPSDARVLEAAERVGLEGLLRTLPRGLASDLAEAGRSLSGGERQRIALGRAYLRSPALLVLDEATSAIDSETEEAIFERLAPWLADRTVLVMAHRLSTVRRLPRVVVLERGRRVGDGAPQVLLATCPPFRLLFASQAETAGEVA
jgi:ATP-binding cassette subfamily B protein